MKISNKLKFNKKFKCFSEAVIMVLVFDVLVLIPAFVVISNF